MTDRELLEQAAKAAGWEIEWEHIEQSDDCNEGDYAWIAEGGHWNPLEDDGDALRLAVKIAATTRVNLVIGSDLLRASADPLADVRRAIVGAAAALGKVAQPANTNGVHGSPSSESTRPSEQDGARSSIGLGAEGEQ